MNALVGFFINRLNLVTLILVLVSLLGLVSLGALRYEIMPSMEMGVVNVTTMKAGAGPEEIELSITLVLEEELLKVDGIDKIFSQSMEGLSLITINVDPDTQDRIQLLSDIQKAIDRAQSRLPEDLIERPLVEELGSKQLPVAELHITGAVAEEVLRRQARLWQQKLRNVPGVSGVDKAGYRRPEVKIQLDQRKLQQLGMSLDEITTAILERNVRDSGGSINTTRGEKATLTVGLFTDPADVKNAIVRSHEPGNAVLLRDVAQVTSGYEDWQIQSRTDGQLSIALRINKNANADELATMAGLRAAIQSESAQLPEGVQLLLVNDVSRFTKDMLQALVTNAWMGFVSVFAVLWLFLGRHVAFWVSVGLPFSILGTFFALLFTGFSVNGMTLVAMILVLGMLVDDAIVTAEAIQARRETGSSYVRAAIEGTRDVAAPVSISVLTTIVAFLPLFTLGGLEGEFIRVVPVVISLMLLISLFESKLLLPAHLAHSRYKAQRRSWLVTAQQLYLRALLLLLNHRLRASLAIAALFAVLAVGATSAIRFQLYPETALDTILVKVELENSTPFEETVTRIHQLEKRLRSLIPAGDLLNTTAEIGHHDTDVYGGSDGRNQAWALLTIYLKPLRQLEEHPMVTLSRLREHARHEKDLQSISVEPLEDTPVLGKPIQLEILSEGDEKLVAAARIKGYLATLPGIMDVWDSHTEGKDVLDLEFNYHNLAAYQLSVKQVANAVRVALDGLIIAEQQLAEERTYFRLTLIQSERKRLRTLNELFIVNREGRPVALSSVATFHLRPGEAAIKHFNGRRTLTVYAEIDRSRTDVYTVNDQLGAYLDQADWRRQFPEIDFYQGGELQQQAQSFGGLGIAFLASVLMILFLLIMLFNSFSQALLILAILPFSLVGVLLAFAVQDLPLSFVALTGVLGLIGVLVNDSVVMVYSLNLEAGPKCAKAVAEKAMTRFRPIVITSVTTLAGLLPTAYGWGGANPFVAPMVMSMVWGVMFGTVISLFLLPCLYLLLSDAHTRLAEAWENNRKTNGARTSQVSGIRISDQ